MGMAEDIVQIKWAISQMGNPADLGESIEAIRDKLKYDIEPKLDQALGNKSSSDFGLLPPAARLEHLRYMVDFTIQNQKIEAIKECMRINKVGMKEAKDFIEWLAEKIVANGTTSTTSNGDFPDPKKPEDAAWLVREIALNAYDRNKQIAIANCQRLTACSEQEAQATYEFLLQHCIKDNPEVE